jgi:hypothetical protein
MKAVLAGRVGASKLYYVIDATDRKTDGVVVSPQGNPRVVNFWKTAMNEQNLVTLKTTRFHQWLWNTPDSETRDRWERVFLKKTQPIDKNLIDGVPINTDVLKAKLKSKSLTERAEEFNMLKNTQSPTRIRNKTGWHNV